MSSFVECSRFVAAFSSSNLMVRKLSKSVRVLTCARNAIILTSRSHRRTQIFFFLQSNGKTKRINAETSELLSFTSGELNCKRNLKWGTWKMTTTKPWEKMFFFFGFSSLLSLTLMNSAFLSWLVDTIKEGSKVEMSSVKCWERQTSTNHYSNELKFSCVIEWRELKNRG